MVQLMTSSKKHPVVCQEWLESGRGWGQRPDGASLHLSRADCDEYIKEYWATMPDDPPDEYERPAGEPTVIDVDHQVYLQIKASRNGVRLWEQRYREMKR